MRADGRRIIVLGGGGHSREVVSCIGDLQAAGRPIELLGLVDEMLPRGPSDHGRILGNFTVLESIVEREAEKAGYITAVGDNSLRRSFVDKAVVATGGRLDAVDLLHPLSHVGSTCSIGPGTYMAPFSSVTAATAIGAHCILNARASVAHDCVIGDFCNLNPAAAICGNVRLGPGCFIGAGATVIDGIEIGARTVVGAGAVVIEDLPADCRAVGVPARIIETHGSG